MSNQFRLGSRSLFKREGEGTLTPKRVVFLSVEGTNTEVDYFKYVEKNREQLRISSIVHVEVLNKIDTNSDLESIFELLEEYIRIRNNGEFKQELLEINLQKYKPNFIRTYLDDPTKLTEKERRKFESVRRSANMDLHYFHFLNNYRGIDDKFGVVIDRDSKSHSLDQMNQIFMKCKERGYLCFISNPCFEFWLLLHVSDVKKEYDEHLDEIRNNDVDAQRNSYVSNLLFSKTNHRKRITKKSFERHYLPNIDKAIKRAKDFSEGLSLPCELIDRVGSNLWELFDVLREKNL